MVGAGAGVGQTKGHVHAGLEGEEFERDQSLVVIHAEDAVEFPGHGAMENGVRRVRAGEVTLAGELFDGGGDDLFFLLPELSVFAGVGIESGHGDARVAGQSPLQKGVEQFPGADDFFGAEQAGHLAQGQVRGGQDHGERSAGQAHGEIFRPGPCGEEFGLPRERKTEGVEGGFMDRAGDDALDGAVLQKPRGFLEGIPRGLRGRGRRLPGGMSVCATDESEVDAAGQSGVGEAAGDEFRSDPGRVAGGDSENGTRGHAQ